MKIITCKTGLKKNIIKKEVFEREIALCANLSKENHGKCGWGICKKCGVLPLLIKLHRGILLEKQKDILKAKNKIFFSNAKRGKVLRLQKKPFSRKKLGISTDPERPRAKSMGSRMGSGEIPLKIPRLRSE